MQVIYFFIAFCSCIIGAISGIGGGLIMKPVIDYLGHFDALTINFLTGTTVLFMSTTSIITSRKQEVSIEIKLTIFLAIGAVFGGGLGKITLLNSGSEIDFLQTIFLLLLNLSVLFYLVFKRRINTLNVKNPFFTLFLGFILGTIASFLGIGGGPINIAALHYFYTMPTKEIVKTSLLLIFLSQATSLIITFVTGSVPDVGVFYLLFMCLGGVLGAYLGKRITEKTSDQTDERMLIIVIIALLMLGIFNIYNYF